MYSDIDELVGSTLHYKYSVTWQENKEYYPFISMHSMDHYLLFIPLLEFPLPIGWTFTHSRAFSSKASKCAFSPLCYATICMLTVCANCPFSALLSFCLSCCSLGMHPSFALYLFNVTIMHYCVCQCVCHLCCPMCMSPRLPNVYVTSIARCVYRCVF